VGYDAANHSAIHTNHPLGLSPLALAVQILTGLITS
jgi:hypothetical protein